MFFITLFFCDGKNYDLFGLLIFIGASNLFFLLKVQIEYCFDIDFNCSP